MIYVTYIFGVLFVLISLLMLYVYWRERHFGLFLMGVTYGCSGLLAIGMPHWWPLLVGFVAVWVLRLIGLEPTVKASAEAGSPDIQANRENRPGA